VPKPNSIVTTVASHSSTRTGERQPEQAAAETITAALRSPQIQQIPLILHGAARFEVLTPTLIRLELPPMGTSRTGDIQCDQSAAADTEVRHNPHRWLAGPHHRPWRSDLSRNWPPGHQG